jgi:uncharacterized linocin/CFP29 family protein
VAKALSELRLAGVAGPYSLLLSADAYTAVSETTEHGYPIREHLNRLLDGDIIWAPAIEGACCSPAAAATTSCGSARTCPSATCPTTPTTVELYFTESFTFAAYTTEASVRFAESDESWSG